MVLKYDEFKEGLFGLDLKKIKEEAYKFSKTSECVLVMSELDPLLLDSVVSEYKQLVRKYGSIDNLVKKLYNKSKTKNEGIVGVSILTAFGMHAFMKMLQALKNGWSLGKYIRKLFYADDRGPSHIVVIKTLKDAIISFAFCIFLIMFIVQSSMKTSDLYRVGYAGTYVDLPFIWTGIQNYKRYDAVGKEYFFKRTKPNNFNIYYKDKLIGYQINGDFFDLRKLKLIKNFHPDEDSSYACYAKFDLEKTLIRGIAKRSVESDSLIKKDASLINKYNKEILKLKNEIDSTKIEPLRENVDAAKKYLSAGLLYGVGMKFIGTASTYDSELKNPESKLSIIKKVLEENNNIGYLGLFIKFLYVEGHRTVEVLSFYKEKILPNKNILNKLRDINGNLKPLIEFDTFESLRDAVFRLEDWAKVNQFIRQLPPTQKNLLWENGWYKPEIVSMSEYITKSIINILKDDDKTKLFMRKVSSIKDGKTFISLLSSASQSEPWDFDYWLDKLDGLKNVVVTWASKEEKQIICVIFTWSAIRKIAYMTNWCIYRESNYFTSYSSKGYQLMLFDFNYPESNNDSVIGFTINTNYGITDCNDKSDRGTILPRKFLTLDKGEYLRVVKSEYITMSVKQLIKKLDYGLIKVVKSKIKHLLNKKYISSFIDFYN